MKAYWILDVGDIVLKGDEELAFDGETENQFWTPIDEATVGDVVQHTDPPIRRAYEEAT
jgi:hypothetical protein